MQKDFPQRFHQLSQLEPAAYPVASEGIPPYLVYFGIGPFLAAFGVSAVDPFAGLALLACLAVMVIVVNGRRP